MKSDYLLVMYAGGLCTYITVDVDFHYICILPDRKILNVKDKAVVKRLASETSWVFCCMSCENYFWPNIRFNSNS